MASKAAAAARHVALYFRHLVPRSSRRVFASGTSQPLCRPVAGSPLPVLLRRRSLATVTGDDDDPHGHENMPRSWFDPEAPPVPGFEYDEKDLASEDALWALYERWCDYHGAERGRDEMLRRFGAFKDRARRIHEFNRSGASFTRALNEFGDVMPEEWVSTGRRCPLSFEASRFSKNNIINVPFY